MNPQQMKDTVQALFLDGKGLLAMDESNPTCNKRFAPLGIPQTEASRRAYRELIVTSPGLGESISGAILYDESIRQKTSKGTPLVDVLVDVQLVLDELVLGHLLQIGTFGAEMRQAIHHVLDQMETIEIVLHAHVKRRCDRALFLVAANVEVLVGAPIGQSMN